MIDASSSSLHMPKEIGNKRTGDNNLILAKEVNNSPQLGFEPCTLMTAIRRDNQLPMQPPRCAMTFCFLSLFPHLSCWKLIYVEKRFHFYIKIYFIKELQ